MEITVRPARVGDAPAMLEIYRPFVEATAVSFETETPSPQAFGERIARTRPSFPPLPMAAVRERMGWGLEE